MKMCLMEQDKITMFNDGFNEKKGMITNEGV